MRKDLPQLANIFDAFGPLLAGNADLRAELPVEDFSAFSIDSVKFSQGVPVLSRKDFSLSWASLKRAADRLMPAMESGFPKIAGELRVIERALSDPKGISGGLDLDGWPVSEDQLVLWASSIGVQKEILEFLLLQLIRAFVEKRAESVALRLHGLQWLKGYCPVCGSWPGLGFLEGQQGQRWLRCSFCGHEWTYLRTSCPFCETQDPDKIEIIFPEHREFERAELCHSCKKYLVSVDVRNTIREVVREVAGLGLVYLDVLAQERGFSSGAPSAWNIL